MATAAIQRALIARIEINTTEEVTSFSEVINGDVVGKGLLLDTKRTVRQMPMKHVF